MFTVANELSYGGFMINKTINPKGPIEPCKESCWITYDGSNIESTTGKDRYIQVQGQIAFELIPVSYTHLDVYKRQNAVYGWINMRIII